MPWSILPSSTCFNSSFSLYNSSGRWLIYLYVQILDRIYRSSFIPPPYFNSFISLYPFILKRFYYLSTIYLPIFSSISSSFIYLSFNLISIYIYWSIIYPLIYPLSTSWNIIIIIWYTYYICLSIGLSILF